MDSSQITIVLTIIGIDLLLSADNAIVIGAAAAKLDTVRRKRAILIGLAGAALFRVLFSISTFHLLQVQYLEIIGGLVLIWIAYNLIVEEQKNEKSTNVVTINQNASSQIFSRVLLAILFADVSMSLDNVLAVAGASQNQFELLIFGLTFSIACMAIAANAVAQLVIKFPFSKYLGALLIGIVAANMIWSGIVN